MRPKCRESRTRTTMVQITATTAAIGASKRRREQCYLLLSTRLLVLIAIQVLACSTKQNQVLCNHNNNNNKLQRYSNSQSILQYQHQQQQHHHFPFRLHQNANQYIRNGHQQEPKLQPERINFLADESNKKQAKVEIEDENKRSNLDIFQLPLESNQFAKIGLEKEKENLSSSIEKSATKLSAKTTTFNLPGKF